MSDRSCPLCGVHPRICVCAFCRVITGAPQLWVLQHPREQGHAKGTLRIARACLPELQVLVGETPADFAPLVQRVAEADDFGLLMPTPQSRALGAAPYTLPRRWVVLDGTWRKATRMFHANPWLHTLPHYHLRDTAPSRYRIRRDRGEHGLSTTEAIAGLLQQCAPHCDTTPLADGMTALVDRYLAQMPVEVRQRYE